MPLSIPPAERRLMHRRAIDVQVFARKDGLFDVVAAVTDTKTVGRAVAGGRRLAGEPLSAVTLRLVVDAQTHIVEAVSQTRGMPCSGARDQDQYGDACAALVGLNLLQGFGLGVKNRLAGIKGCTHLIEMCQVLPQAVIQAFAGVALDTHEGHATGPGPVSPQFDRCHALRRDGATVKTHYPRWFRNGGALTASATARPASISSF